DERRFTIRDNGSATVRGALSEDIAWTFRAIPDRPPTIALVKDPEAQARGGLHLVYRLEDDYGVVSARAAFTPKQQAGDTPQRGRALFGPPDFSLLLPQARTRNGVGQTTREL